MSAEKEDAGGFATDAGRNRRAGPMADTGVRRQIDDSLITSEQRYRTLLEALPAYEYSVRVEDGKPLATEHGLGSVSVTGYTPEDYARDPNLWIQMVPAEDRDLVRDFAARNLAGQPTPSVEHRIIHRDGRVRWVRGVVVQRRDEAGRLVRYDALVEDITARKVGELAIRESERVRAIGTLAGGVAHDFNNIMNVIAGNAALIADASLPKTAPHEAATHILDAARHAGDITKRLMGVARMSEGGAESAAMPVDVAGVIRSTIELAGRALADRNVQVVFRNPDSAVVVRANADQLLDVLMNLMLNAAEAMPEGGTITIGVSEKTTSLPRLASPAAPRSRFVVVRVQDTGCGMSAEQQKHIFEPFFTTRQAEGVFGLGLTVLRNVVMGWGGWVSVRSREGRGTSFRLLLPKAQAVPQVVLPAAAVRHTVLIADDDPAALNTMRRVLEEQGHTVIAVERANEAMETYRREAARIDVCVVDLLLPPPGGRAVVEAILEHDAHTGIVVTSGFSREYARGALAHGAWSFVQKPIDEDRFLKTIASFAERHSRP